MSQIPNVLNITEDDVSKMLACNVHIGSTNISPTMVRYVWKRNIEGVHIIDLRKTWEKLQLAARVIAQMQNSQDVCAVALTSGESKQSPIAQRAVLKFSQHIECRHLAGRFTPGTFTNRIQSNFFEPRLLVVSDPIKDFQPILESSYVNMPVIAMADIDSPTRHIDIVIPCNTKGKESVALMWWLLAREVLRIKGVISRHEDWDVLVDMFVFRDQEEQEKLSQRTYGGDLYPTSIFETQVGEQDEDKEDQHPDHEGGFHDQENVIDDVGEPGGISATWNSKDEEWGGGDGGSDEGEGWE
jgi:small subunit ribosomal protein SAe